MGQSPKGEEARCIGGAVQTILLVDDEWVVIEYCKHVLGPVPELRLLSAQSGEEAVAVASGYNGPIHLLVTDITMPGMSGVALAEQLTASRPDIKILFISGYPPENLDLKHGWMFLAKPFIPSDLIDKIADILAEAPSTSRT
jgi:CheY-like chemotaxis protein